MPILSYLGQPKKSLKQSNGVFTPEPPLNQPTTRARQRQDNDKTNIEPVHSYDAFHTRSGNDGVKGIIGMHRFNICLVVVLLWCENTMRLGTNSEKLKKRSLPPTQLLCCIYFPRAVSYASSSPQLCQNQAPSLLLFFLPHKITKLKVTYPGYSFQDVS